MPRPPGQSDFVFEQPVEIVDVELPEEARVVQLPRATAISKFASAGATKWMLILTAAMLIALVLLLMIGPHIPAGE